MLELTGETKSIKQQKFRKRIPREARTRSYNRLVNTSALFLFFFNTCLPITLVTSNAIIPILGLDIIHTDVWKYFTEKNIDRKHTSRCTSIFRSTIYCLIIEICTIASYEMKEQVKNLSKNCPFAYLMRTVPSPPSLLLVLL